MERLGLVPELHRRIVTLRTPVTANNTLSAIGVTLKQEITTSTDDKQ